MRYGKRLVCALLAALTLTACGERAEDGQQGFTLRACVCAPLASLDPALCDDPAAEPVFYAVYDNLMRLSPDGEGGVAVVPAVAKEYETAENFDGTVDYVFTLSPSARWSDGARVKAKDFVYAWRRLADPATEAPDADILSVVSGYDAVRASGDATKLGVRAESDGKLCVTLTAPCAYFISDVCTAVATMPLRADVAERNPDWAASGGLPCNGPFRISVWAKKESLYLQRNDAYYGSRAMAIRTLRFVFADTALDAAHLYADGAVDYVSPAYAGAEDAGDAPLRSVTCVLYDHMSDVFSNAHVRRAFDLVLDRAAMAAEAGGGQTAATGFVPRGVVNGGEGADFRAAGGALLAVDEEGYAERCAEAEDEMRVSGYRSVLDFPEVACLYPLEDGDAAAAAAAAVRVWQEKLRVPVRAEGLLREQFDQRVAEGEFDLAIDTFSTPWGDALSYLAPYAGLDGANALHYVSKPYDLLIGVAESSRGDARAAILHDAEALLLEDTALSPLWFGGKTYLLRDGFAGVFHDARGNAYFSAAYEEA